MLSESRIKRYRVTHKRGDLKMGKTDKFEQDLNVVDFVNDVELVKCLRFVSQKAWELEVFGNEEKDGKLEKLVDKALVVVERRIAHALTNGNATLYHESRKELEF